METEEIKCTVAVIGGGITGSAVFYMLAKYTDVKKIALIEKYPDLARVNSHFDNNSQTLHFGDIETNYSLEKALRVKEAAEMTKTYLEKFDHGLFLKNHKMVLAVGAAEVGELEKRFKEFKEYYPKLRLIRREEIARLEPKVVEGRDPREKIAALATEDGYAVDYHALAKSLVRSAEKSDPEARYFLGHKVKNVSPEGKTFKIATDKKIFRADFVVFAAGAHSLIFAKSLGYGKEFGILPVAGSFYVGDDLLRGKVYRVQIKGLPFAAVHGDPNVNNPRQTRFGPTAKVLPLLERHHWTTIPDFLKTSVWSLRGVLSLLAIISDRTIFKFVFKNLLYDLPFFGKRQFLKNIRKIIPSLEISDIKYGRGIGGIRPQVVNTKTRKLEMDEAKIIGTGLIFDITPSPGASVCLKNAEKDARIIIEHFKGKYRFDEEKFKRDFQVSA